METRIPCAGEFYYHFKKKLYQIVAIATHSETREQMVVYQALYGDFGIYVRPLEMFVSEVDHVKYPNVTQRYRFEKITREQAREVQEGAVLFTEPSVQVTAPMQQIVRPAKEQEREAEQFLQEAVQSVTTSEAQPVEEEEQPDPRLLQFLEADSYEEKYQVLISIESEITDRLIDDIAVVMDIVIPEGEITDRFMELKKCISTLQKYETGRLR